MDLNIYLTLNFLDSNSQFNSIQYNSKNYEKI